METRVIGKSVPRKEGREKVTGRARYVDDLMFPGMMHGVTVRSPAARGRIRGDSFRRRAFRGTNSPSSPRRTFPEKIASLC